MSELKLTTENVRTDYVNLRIDTNYRVLEAKAEAEFDGWLNRIKAEAWAEGYAYCGEFGWDGERIPNPYLEGENK